MREDGEGRVKRVTLMKAGTGRKGDIRIDKGRYEKSKRQKMSKESNGEQVV